MAKSSSSTTSVARVDYIDALRVISVLLLIPFHVARIFDVWETFYAKNAEVSPALTSIVAFLNPWHMPLLFVLAGAAGWLALRKRSGGEYRRERVKRLIIPFVFALFVIIPPQAYLGMLTHGMQPGSYLEFYPTFFQIQPDDLSGYVGTFTPGHMWFVLFLFFFSLIALPLFLYLRGEVGARKLDRLATFLERRGAIYLFVIVLAFTEMLPDLGGKNPFTYILLFIAGYVLMAHPRMMEIVEQRRRLALLLGVISMATVFAVWLSGVRMVDFSPESIAFAFLRHLNTWAWVIALLGFGRSILNRGGAWLRHASEIAYPFYILHQTVIVIVGYVVVQWPIELIAKFLIISIASLAITVALCELVKLANVTRFLFGMKSKTRASNTVLVEQPATN